MATPASAADLTHIDLNNTIGALQIGSLFGVFLFGVVTLQTWNYYDTYRDDGWINKALVATVWILEIAHTLGINYEVYRATIVLYGKPWLLVRFQGIGAVVVFGGGITLITQTFFARRLSKLLPRPYSHIGYFCIAVSGVRFIATVYLTVEGITAPTISGYQQECGWIISATFIASAAVDIIIAISMMYYLSRRKKQVARISKLLDRLVTYTIRSGLLTSVAAIVLIICFQVMPNNFIWLAVYTFVAKLYSNSFLSALNARKNLRRDIMEKTSVTPDHFVVRPDRNLNFSVFSLQETRSTFQPVIVTVNTTRETVAESPDCDKIDSESCRDESFPAGRAL